MSNVSTLCFKPEDLLVMIFKEKARLTDPSEAVTYRVQITERKVFPEAYNECQSILKKNCLEDPFLCGKTASQQAMLAFSMEGNPLSSERVQLRRRSPLKDISSLKSLLP